MVLAVALRGLAGARPGSPILVSAVGRASAEAAARAGGKTEPHILTPLEASRLVRNVTSPHDLLIALLAFGGLRIGEAFAMCRGDIDVATCLVVVDENLAEANGTLVFDTPKSHQKRTLTLAPSLMKRLSVYLDKLPGGDWR